MIRFNNLLAEAALKDTYPYERVRTRWPIVFGFESGENNYETVFKDVGGGYVNWSFKTEEGGFNDLTGEGNPMKIIRTNMKIIRDFIQSSNMKGVKYRAEPRRNRIYKRYFNRVFNDPEINQEDKTTTVTINGSSNR
jgi:hypothetical protein